MKLSLKKYFIILIIILLIIHIGYFTYGFNHFKSFEDADIYFTFYRFKFYDDVSISHFFVTSIFLFFSTIVLIKNYRKINYSPNQIGLLLIGIFLTVILSCTFFISFSLGQRTKIHTLLTEEKFNEDKTLVNTLNVFLFNNITDKVNDSFDVENVLYPEPYPVIMSLDTIEYMDGSIYEEENYYSIDTIVLEEKTYEKLSKLAGTAYSVLNDFEIPEIDFKNDIISKQTYNDSIEIIYKGREVHPNNDLSTFMMNSNLFNRVRNKPIFEQRYEAAKERYNLLFTYKIDSLNSKLGQLQNILNKYKIEAEVNSEKLAKNIINANKSGYSIGYLSLDNYIDRPALEARFTTLDKLFYEPQYFHQSIRGIFFIVTITLTLLITLLFLMFNKLKNNKQ